MHAFEAAVRNEAQQNETLWALDGEDHVELDCDRIAAPLKIAARDVRDFRDWLTGWLEQHTGAGATLLDEQPELMDPEQHELGPFQAGSETSRQAALDNYPRAGTQRWRILQDLRRVGTSGRTRQELAHLLDLSENTIRPRIVELMEGGWVNARTEDGPDGGRLVTRKTKDGSLAEVLVLTERGRQGDTGEGGLTWPTLGQ